MIQGGDGDQQAGGKRERERERERRRRRRRNTREEKEAEAKYNRWYRFTHHSNVFIAEMVVVRAAYFAISSRCSSSVTSALNLSSTMCFTMPAIPPPPCFLLLTHTQIFKNRETNTHTHTHTHTHTLRRDLGAFVSSLALRAFWGVLKLRLY